MIDSGSVSTFINFSTAKKLNLLIFPKQKTLSLADDHQKARIVGEVIVNVTLENNIFNNFVMEVMENLFTDVIVGKDLLKNFEKVTFKFGGPKQELFVGAIENAIFPEMKVDPPPLFSNLSSDVTPVATKSRRYSEADHVFIKSETERLLKQGIIEPAVSPWRAQVLVVSSDSHKPRLVVD